MNPEVYQWEVNIVKDRYYSLDLSFEQAEQVYRFEKERDIYVEDYSEGHHFSHWEEQDYALDNFTRILSADQLILYKKDMEESNRRYVEELVGGDERHRKSVEYFRALAGYYKDVYIPAWFRDSAQAYMVPFTGRDKIKYLRAEYHRYFDTEKKKLLVHHYRQRRLFCPQLLQLTLWKHECGPLLWGYEDFRRKMDTATRAVAEFLLEKYRSYPEQFADFFQKKEEELAVFSKAAQASHLGEPEERIGGWHTTMAGPTALQLNEQRILQVLLTEQPTEVHG